MLRNLNKYKDSIINLHSQGYNDTNIASILNINREQIRKIRNHLKLPINKEDKHSIYRESFNKFLKEGLSGPEIAKELNISLKTVNYLKEKWNKGKNKPKNIYTTKTDRLKGYMLRNIKHSAFARNRDFNLVYTDLELPKYCPILGLELEYGKSLNSWNCASVDEIIPEKGYTKGNIIIMSRLANMMKNCANFEHLELFCKNITKLTNHYKIQGALGSITDVFPDTIMYEET
jgi:transposase